MFDGRVLRIAIAGFCGGFIIAAVCYILGIPIIFTFIFGTIYGATLPLWMP